MDQRSMSWTSATEADRTDSAEYVETQMTNELVRISQL